MYILMSLAIKLPCILLGLNKYLQQMHGSKNMSNYTCMYTDTPLS